MAKKGSLGIGIGLVILIIVAGIAYRNYGYSKQARNEVKVLNTIIDKKDMEVVKLAKEVKAKQDELSGVRVELDQTKKALNDTKAEVNKLTQQPAIQAPQTVKK